MKKIFASLASIGSFLFPVLAFAQISTGQDVGGVLTIITSILNTVIPILITLAFILFIYGVLLYITAKDETKKKEGRERLIQGIVGLAIILLIWGIIGIIGRTFGLQAGQQLDQLPSIVQ